MCQQIVTKYTARLMALLLALLLLLACVPLAFAEEGGSCGDNLNWIFADGILTITGSGDMWDFPEETMAPWYSLRSEIRTLVLPEGLSRVGALAFYDCNRVTAAVLPDSVKSVGEYAFAKCESLQVLSLGSSIQTIENDAFHGCWSLEDLRLPQSLQSIGDSAFYNCEKLRSVVIPSGVSSIGSAVFAYCTSLVRAEMQSRLTKLPEWTFYGCSQLSTVILPETISQLGSSALRECDSLRLVSYGGSSMTPDQLRQTIMQDNPIFGSVGVVTPENPGNTAVSGIAAEKPDGTVNEQFTTVTNGQNSNVTSTIDRNTQSGDKNSISTDITVTIDNPDGWKEAQEAVDNALKEQSNMIRPDTTTGTTNITINIKNDESVNKDFMDSLAGKDVVVNVNTQDGTGWKIDCGNLNGKDLPDSYDMHFTQKPAGDQALEQMGTTQGIQLEFDKDANVEAEVLVRLPDSMIHQNVTLFKDEGSKGLTKYQTVVVDNQGYAHLTLGSVEAGVKYYLGVNVPGTAEEAVIPDTLKQDYVKMDYVEPVRYEITGRSSSWGIGLGRVMAILAAVMATVIVLVGVIMFMYNKQRLRNGYVPKWDDDDDE